jgi:hypothetical protein
MLVEGAAILAVAIVDGDLIVDRRVSSFVT